MLVSLTRILTALVGGSVNMRFRRRPVLLSTCVVIMACFLSISCYSYLMDLGGYEDVLESLNWLPALDAVIAFASMSIGYGTITFLIVGEILPTESKDTITSFVIFVQYIGAFIFLKSIPFLLSSMGIHGMFLLFFGIMLFSATFSAILMPETQGLSLFEIQKNFRGDKRDVEA